MSFIWLAMARSTCAEGNLAVLVFGEKVFSENFSKKSIY